MSGITDLERILHHIRVKLYPNYLPDQRGTYIARTDSDKTVNIRDVCTIMVTRAGFDGDFNTLQDYVDQFFEELAYQLCDGFTVNCTYFSVHPNIGGVFTSEREAHDHKKHPITFRFSALAKLRALAKNIDVEIEGIADMPAYIDEFMDLEEKSTNNIYVPGNGFAVHGHNIKVDGNDPACGVFFVPVADPTKRVKATRILENNPSKVIGVAPSTGYPLNKVEIVTQFTKGNVTLVSPRTITSRFTLEEV